jgi:hypothetical protein
MDARKWRIRKRAGLWCVFEPGWVFTPIGKFYRHADAIHMAGRFRALGIRTKGRRER